MRRLYSVRSGLSSTRRLVVHASTVWTGRQLPYHALHVFDRSDPLRRPGGTSPASCTSPLPVAVLRARETEADGL